MRQFYPHYELNFPDAPSLFHSATSLTTVSAGAHTPSQARKPKRQTAGTAPKKRKHESNSKGGSKKLAPMEEEDDDIPKRFRRHMERRSNLGKPPKGHPGTSRFPCIRWDLREKKWKGILCLEGSEVSRVNKTFGFSSSSEEGAAKLWDKLARVARDEYGLKGTGTDFSEREMNFSPDGREHHACVLSRRHTHTRGRMRDRTHAPRHTHTHAHR